MVTEIQSNIVERKPIYPFLHEFTVVLGLFIIFPLNAYFQSLQWFNTHSLYGSIGIGIALVFRITLYFIDRALFENAKLYFIISGLFYMIWLITILSNVGSQPNVVPLLQTIAFYFMINGFYIRNPEKYKLEDFQHKLISKFIRH